METRNHFKTGRNLKSLTSRKNYTNAMKFDFIESSGDILCSFKKLFLCSSVMILCFQITDGQCKLERLKDDFSSSKTAYTKDVTIASVFPLIGSKKPWDLDMSFLLIDSTCTLMVIHKDQARSSHLDYVYFKFKDGTIIKKENPLDAGTYNTGLGNRYATTGFLLTKEELTKLGTVELSKFQASLKNNIDYPLVEEEIKQKNAEKIRINASCILEELNTIPTVKNAVKKDIAKDIEYTCKYSIDEIDGFTKKRTVFTNGGPLLDVTEGVKRIWINAVGNNTNGVNGVRFEWGFMSSGTYDKNEVQNVLKFDQVDLLLDNEKIITLTNKEVSKFFSGDYCISYKLFTMNDSLWTELKSVPLKKLKFSFNNEDVFSPDIERKYSKSIMNVINCIDVLGILKSK